MMIFASISWFKRCFCFNHRLCSVVNGAKTMPTISKSHPSILTIRLNQTNLRKCRLVRYVKIGNSDDEIDKWSNNPLFYIENSKNQIFSNPQIIPTKELVPPLAHLIGIFLNYPHYWAKWSIQFMKSLLNFRGHWQNLQKDCHPSDSSTILECFWRWEKNSFKTLLR